MAARYAHAHRTQEIRQEGIGGPKQEERSDAKPNSTRLTPVDLMNQHIDTECGHAIEHLEIELVLELRLEQILHPHFFAAHHTRREGHDRRAQLEGEDADLVRGDDDGHVGELGGGQLADPE